MPATQKPLFDDAPFAFGPKFLHDYAGQIITDARVAVIELIANAYDAGASEVRVIWPTRMEGHFEVGDNGTGMTAQELHRRWRTLSYSRLQEQGEYVEYPPGKSGGQRLAFGQNGKGRLGPFCFCDSYEIETLKAGEVTFASVTLAQGGDRPFRCQIGRQQNREGHGTSIRGVVLRNAIAPDELSAAIGSKFLVDPYFSIFVNDERLQLLDIDGVRSSEITCEPYGTVSVHQIDALVQDRTTQLRGITWWVNGRMVGVPSWDGLDGRGAVLDGRTTTAKRCSFVAAADLLKADVKQDWTGFHDSKRSLRVRQAVRDHVIDSLNALLAETRTARKREALAESREALGRLPRLSRRIVGQFVDQVQRDCPTLSQGDLARTVDIFAKLEQARSGYELLEKLAACSPDDLDTWNTLMEEWTASSADVVLTELKRRLDLIEQLQQLVDVATTDELHDLQPLFARGLWVFGPEYESVEFTSNRSMATAIREMLGGTEDEAPARRPDFVALPDRSIGVYAADEFDAEGEVSGVHKVLIVELKKGGFNVGVDELRQGEDYALGLQAGSLVGSMTRIVVFVLGAEIAGEAAEERMVGDSIRVVPMVYERLLKRAHARTFNLQCKLKAVESHGEGADPDVEAVLQDNPQPLFGGQTSG